MIATSGSTRLIEDDAPQRRHTSLSPDCSTAGPNGRASLTATIGRPG
jgi:hypothetical protein